MSRILQLTSSVPEDVVETDYLGPWCIDGDTLDNSLVKELSNVDVIPVFKERDEIYEHVVVTLSNWLNAIHDEDKSRVYWETLLFRFLGLYVNEIIPRFLFLNEALKKVPDIQICTLSESQFISFTDDASLRLRYDTSDKVNLQFFSQIAHSICDSQKRGSQCQTATFSFAARSVNETQSVSVQQSIRKIIFRTRSLVFRRRSYRHRETAYKDNEIVLFSTHFSNAVLSLIEDVSKVKFRFATVGEETLKDTFDKELRNTLTARPNASLLEKSIIDTLKYNLPKDYVEHFKTYKTAVDTKIKKQGAPDHIMIGFSPGFIDRLWIAECHNRNTQLLIVQHGGAYGESIKMPWQKGELNVADEYISWGWSGERIVALPSPRIMQMQVKRAHPTKVLLVLRMDYLYPKLDYSLQSSHSTAQANFLGALKSDVREHVVARVRLDKHAMGSKQASWRADFPEVTIDSGSQSIHKQFSESKIVVVDYFFSTTFTECVAAGIPVIVFSEDQNEVIHPDARTIYDALSRVGVIHHSATSAAKLVNSIENDPESWWRDEERQNAVADYMHMHARLSDHAVKLWGEYLDKQIN